MAIKCRDIMNFMEEIAPQKLAEEWDNVGLMIGRTEKDIQKILICLDVTEKVVQEAIEGNFDMIISHHPLILRGIKKINDTDLTGKMLLKLAEKGICVYSAHTNMDIAENGVNDTLAKVLGVSSTGYLKITQREKIYKLAVYVPEEDSEEVRNAICDNGAGWMGNYSDCSFQTHGQGTFRPLEGSNPYIGNTNELERVKEVKIETIVPEGKLKGVVSAMIDVHPYEEVAYDIYPLKIEGTEIGLGRIGSLEKELYFDEFIRLVKDVLNIDSVIVYGKRPEKIKRLAVFCGSLDDSWKNARNYGIDTIVTGEVKYHSALEMASEGLCVIQAGHYATERIIVNVLVEAFKNKFPNVFTVGSQVETDPARYC